MSSTKEFLRLREQAVALRQAGKSRREIKDILHITSNATLNDVLKGEPPPDWTRRPNAKDDLRAKARDLREQSLDYEEIAAQLGVSKSSVSLWVRDLPRPPGLSYEERRKRAAAGVRRYWDTERHVREAQRAAARTAAAAEIGALTDREIIIAGAIAYWCEGAKNKPYRRFDRVIFTNSDPLLIGFFLRFLYTAGVRPDQCVFRVYIHENADIEAAQRFWLERTGTNPSQFRTPSLKRHNPRTRRTNVGEGYRGFLRVEVRCSTKLYRKIEGWSEGIVNSADDI